MSVIGDNINFLRKKHGLTQEELASRIFVTRTAVSKWEQGKTDPNLETLKLLAKEFNCTIDELISEKKIELNNINVVQKENILIEKQVNETTLLIESKGIISCIITSFLSTCVLDSRFLSTQSNSSKLLTCIAF